MLPGTTAVTLDTTAHALVHAVLQSRLCHACPGRESAVNGLFQAVVQLLQHEAAHGEEQAVAGTSATFATGTGRTRRPAAHRSRGTLCATEARAPKARNHQQGTNCSTGARYATAPAVRQTVRQCKNGRHSLSSTALLAARLTRQILVLTHNTLCSPLDPQYLDNDPRILVPTRNALCMSFDLKHLGTDPERTLCSRY